jgi:hypothetical protein
MSNMAKCSFCGQDRKLSKEHIWSSALLRLFDNVAPFTIDECLGRVHQGDPILKDLCRECNNSMSPADAAMSEFAKKYLTGSLATHMTVDFTDCNILRWVMKTVSNHERSINTGTAWWKHFIEFFCGQLCELSRVDVLLAPWEDLSPGGVAMYLMGVQTLGAREMQFIGLRKSDVKAVDQLVDCRWVLKVGSGVFALIVWKPGVPQDLRATLVSELQGYGWLLAGKDTKISRIPFNAITCVMYNIPSDPDCHNPVEQSMGKRGRALF